MRKLAVRKRALRRAWFRFKTDRPGTRFEHFHWRRQKHRRGFHSIERVLSVGGGIALSVLGLVLVPAPGPGWLIVATGFTLLASESLVLARFLDWTELTLRRLFRPEKSPDPRNAE